MTSPIVPCFLYFVYAVSFVIFAWLMQVETSSEMFTAIVKRFEVVPWSQNPDRLLMDVQGGPEVHEWLTKVFLPQLYEADPAENLGHGYCTEKYPCKLGEGNVHEDSECARYLKKGTDNCPSYMGGSAGCCEPCIGTDCPAITLKLKGSWQEGNTSVPSLSATCASGPKGDLPSWLPLLPTWPKEAASHTSIPGDPTSFNFQFCPERLGRLPQNAPMPRAARTLTIAGFNQVLVGRLTMKRVKLQDSPSSKYKQAYPRYQSAHRISAFAQTTDDNQAQFGTTETYDYSSGGGFFGAGGFVHFLDFSKSQASIRRELNLLQDNHWFDLNQGSFALEMLFFNGNYEMFTHVSFVFEHDISGQSNTYVLTQPLNMSYTNINTGVAFWIRIFCLLIMVMGFFGFLKSEVDSMSTDPLVYWTSAGSIIQFTSLILSIVSVIMWCALVFSYPYQSAKLPMPSDSAKKIAQFEDIVGLARHNQIFSDVIAVTLCLIIIRCILHAANMTPFLKVIVDTIGTAKWDLIAYISVFAILFLGFTFAGFTLCGRSIYAFSTPLSSLVTCLKMVMGVSGYDLLYEGDEVLGLSFFFSFHLFFIIIQNVLLAIITLSYYKERKKIDDPSVADKFPLKRFMRQVRTSLRDWTRIFVQCIATVWQFLFGSGGGSAIRVNYEQVNLYRDKRCAYRPKYRSVQYEAKQDDYASDVRMPHEDVKLRAKNPFYPGGMMNYYVDSVSQEGLAGENGVKEHYRLVAIQQQGESNPMTFREKEIFEASKDSKIRDGTKLTGFEKDVSNILAFPPDHPPITLEFEGWVEPVSCECIGNFIFVVVFSLFLAFSMRISDCFYSSEVQVMSLFKPQWFAYNPTRVQNYSQIEDFFDVDGWFETSVIQHQYGCITSVGDPSRCLTEDNEGFHNRKGWSLYAGPGGIVSTGPEGGMGFIPPATQGMSLGYVPWSGQVGGTPNWGVEIETVPRMYHWNMGFMANNYVRSTIQVACFERNSEPKWEHGYPFVLNRIIKTERSGCASKPCMRMIIEDVRLSGKACLDNNGKIREAQVQTGSWSGLNYTYTERGTYAGLGGIAIGMGGTKMEAETVAHLISQDQMMRGDFVNSLVVEYVSYNEHLDLFSFNMVGLSVLATGKMQKEFRSIVFPLNVFSAGQQSNSAGIRTMNYVLWALVLICLVSFAIHFLRDVYIQWRIISELQKPKLSFAASFFAESWWNIYDFSTLLVNIANQYFLFKYMCVESGFEGGSFSSWTINKYTFNQTADESRQDAFYDFSLAAHYYDWYTILSAFSLLFISLRTIKYMVAIQQLRLVVLTISTAIWELLAMLLMLTLALFGFACMFYIYYGNRHPEFGTITGSFCVLFIYMCGIFDNTEKLFHDNPVFFSIAFCTVQLIIYFILANMFLAACVYKWKEVRRSAQEDAISTLKGCWKSLSCIKRSTEKAGDTIDNRVPLNETFWQARAMLNYLDSFDESGKIVVRVKTPAGKSTGHDGGTGAEGGGKENEEEAAQATDKSTTRDTEKISIIFKKAHMEIASQMSCNASVRLHDAPEDHGAGIQAMLEHGTMPPQHHHNHHEAAFDDAEGEKEYSPILGIVEQPVEPGAAKKITNDLESKLQDDHQQAGKIAQEIWLDALVTVLEDIGALKRVQNFFLPPPMIRPRNQQQHGAFDQKKVKMEQRLDKFLRLLIESTKTQHYKYLKDSAKTKEKGLKQQSLVFADYLDRLEKRIKELQQEIKVLERKNTEMRSHVAPLL